jgi:hypothetical protein
LALEADGLFAGYLFDGLRRQLLVKELARLGDKGLLVGGELW